ncbi:MAG: hypothetical protein HON90_03585 [Halobacteriovoraceae bacterium]|nr:hypothetical protein [Halobacteriovoraceae bacterium]
MGQKMLIHCNERGQSAIEFILTFAFAIGVTFLFLNQAMNLTEGYLAHYVNFMSARTYLVYDSGIDTRNSILAQAEREAESVYKSYPLASFGVQSTLKVITSDQGSALFSGTVLQFEKALSAMPVVGGGKKALLYSESFLGKEPLRITCAQMMCAAITGTLQDCQSNSTDMDIVLYDNGC